MTIEEMMLKDDLSIHNNCLILLEPSYILNFGNDDEKYKNKIFLNFSKIY